MCEQLARPHGLFGRFVVGRLLDRANANAHSLVLECLDHNPRSRVLEIGFGGGGLLFRIAESLDGGCVEGLEVSPEMLAAATRRRARLGLEQGVALHLGSVDNLPFEDASFDCACSVHSIYFWPDLLHGLKELARVLRPGGRLVLGFSAATDLHRDGYAERGFKIYTNQEITRLCQQANFSIERIAEIGRKPQGTFHAWCGVRS